MESVVHPLGDGPEGKPVRRHVGRKKVMRKHAGKPLYKFIPKLKGKTNGLYYLVKTPYPKKMGIYAKL
jgi:hypothetical protein